MHRVYPSIQAKTMNDIPRNSVAGMLQITLYILYGHVFGRLSATIQFNHCETGRNDLFFLRKSYEECLDECKARVSCVSVNYHTRVKLCKLHDGNSTTNPCPGTGFVYSKKTDWNFVPSDACSGCQEGQSCNKDVTTNSFSCHFTECQAPSHPLFGTVLGNTWTVGSRVSYKCNHGYALSGNVLSRTCLDTGVWSGEETQCVCKTKEILNPSIPSHIDVGETAQDKVILISGMPQVEGNRFGFTIQRDVYNVAMILEVRFQHLTDIETIVMNTRTNGVWGDELQYHDFPFQWGERFDMEIHCEPDYFRVNVTNTDISYILQRRTDNGQGDNNMLVIYDDVSVDSVSWNETCRSDPVT